MATKLSKRQKAQEDSFDRTAEFSLTDAVKLVKENATAKFDETVDIVVSLGVNPVHSDQVVRGMTSLPHGTGKSIRVAVMARDAKADEAKKAGADIVGAEDLADKIKAGDIDFDRLIATPDMMPLVGQLGQILGPKGLMPNPKVGTVTPDVTKAVGDAKGGAVEFRAEKKGIVHAGVGKASFDQKKLEENISAFLEAIIKAKPTGAKGTYMKKASLSSSMGPSIKLDLTEMMEKRSAA